MASVWRNNKLLKKWEQKTVKKIANGNFNCNFAYSQLLCEESLK